MNESCWRRWFILRYRDLLVIFTLITGTTSVGPKDSQDEPGLTGCEINLTERQEGQGTT